MIGKKFDFLELFEAYSKLYSSPIGLGQQAWNIKWGYLSFFLYFLPFLISNYTNSFEANLVLLIYSCIMCSAGILFIIKSEKEDLQEIKITNYIFSQFFHFLLAILFFGFIYFYIWKINPSYFNTPNIDITYFDMVYFSFVTVATLGYGEIYPIHISGKLVVIYELIFGFWFVVNVISISISFKGEYIKHQRIVIKKWQNTVIKLVNDEKLLFFWNYYFEKFVPHSKKVTQNERIKIKQAMVSDFTESKIGFIFCDPKNPPKKLKRNWGVNFKLGDFLIYRRDEYKKIVDFEAYQSNDK